MELTIQSVGRHDLRDILLGFDLEGSSHKEEEGVVYSWCSWQYGCTRTISFSGGGRALLMESPMLWRVLWQPGPPGHKGRGSPL